MLTGLPFAYINGVPIYRPGHHEICGIVVNVICK